MKAKLLESKVANLPERAQPSRGGSGQTPATGVNHQQPSFGGSKKLYSEALTTGLDKRYKLTVRSKSKQSPEMIKTVLRTYVNPTEMRVGIKTFKSLKDGRVLIEAGSLNEINQLSTTISDNNEIILLSAYTMVSRTVAFATMIVFPGTPQNWVSVR